MSEIVNYSNGDYLNTTWVGKLIDKFPTFVIQKGINCLFFHLVC